MILAKFGKLVHCWPLLTRIWSNDPWFNFWKDWKEKTARGRKDIGLVAFCMVFWPWFLWSNFFPSHLWQSCTLFKCSVCCLLPFSNSLHRFDPNIAQPFVARDFENLASWSVIFSRSIGLHICLFRCNLVIFLRNLLLRKKANFVGFCFIIIALHSSPSSPLAYIRRCITSCYT